jgi:rod shape-determining protein MreD
MKRISGYFLLGFLFVLLQTSLWPQLLPSAIKPDLILVLVVYLGLSESHLSGGLLSFLLGACLDAVAGSHQGLHGVTLLLIFFGVRFATDHLNTESSRLVLLMVGLGTLVYAGLLVLFASFADAGALWLQVLRVIFPQTLLNICSAWLLLKLAPYLQRRLAPSSDLSTLRRMGKNYGD